MGEFTPSSPPNRIVLARGANRLTFDNSVTKQGRLHVTVEVVGRNVVPNGGHVTRGFTLGRKTADQLVKNLTTLFNL